MKPSEHILPTTEPPARPVPAWLLIPLGLVLLLLSAGCTRQKLTSLLPNASQTDLSLHEVLPGQWSIHSNGYHLTAQFGRHSEMLFVLDVPADYQTKLNQRQISVAGNYFNSGNDIDITVTDERLAAALAQMPGWEFHHIRVRNFTGDKIEDAARNTWERIIPGTQEGSSGEARRELADASAAALSPMATVASAAPETPRPTARDKMTGVFAKFETRRRRMNRNAARILTASDSTTLAAFPVTTATVAVPNFTATER